MPEIVSLMLPCYLPPVDWASHLVEVLDLIGQQLPAKYSLEIILVNDGSKLRHQDLDLLKNNFPGLIYIQSKQNHGKGHAVRLGAAAATGKFLIVTDIDVPYSLANFFSILQALEAGADISWVVRSPEYYHHIPKMRTFLSKLLQKIIQWSFHTPYSDTQGGLKGFSEKGKKILLETSIPRYLYDLELIILGHRKMARLHPIVGQLRKEINMSGMPLRNMLQELISLFVIRFRR